MPVSSRSPLRSSISPRRPPIRPILRRPPTARRAATSGRVSPIRSGSIRRFPVDGRRQSLSGLLKHDQRRIAMAGHDAPFVIEDTDESEISSDVAGLGNLLMTTHIPLRADGSIETGDIRTQSTCTLESLKTSLEKAGSSLADVIHLTIYLTDMA